MKIACNIILDLIPLVKDHVASEDSIRLVSEHLKSCESCLLEFENDALPKETKIDDIKVISSIRKKLLFIASALLLAGASIGMILNNSVSSNFIPILIIILSILLAGILIFKYDLKGGNRMNRFFMGKAIGTIIVFAALGIYLLLKYGLHLF